MATNAWQNGGVDNNWSTAGNWSLGHKPAAGEDVTMSAAYNCVINEATAALNSFDMTGYANTLSGSSDITVTVASGTSVVLFAGTKTWTGVLKLNPAAGTTINLTMGGMTTCGGVTITGTTTGAVYFLDGFTLAATKIVTLTSGTLHTDGATDNAGLVHSWGLFYYGSSSAVRNIYFGNSDIGITGTGNVWSCSTNTNLTMYANTADITFSGADANVYGGHQAYGGSINFTGSGKATWNNSSSGLQNINSLSRIGTNSSTDSFEITFGNTGVISALTLTGYSASNRLLVSSGTIGTKREITCSGTALSCNNVDFRDITFARSDAGALDLTNSGANLVGNCGGNTKTLGDSSTLTFTDSADQHWIDSDGGNWSDSGNWTSRVPLPQDDVYMDCAFNASKTVTGNMPRLGKSISWAGATGTPTYTPSISATIYGSWTAISGMNGYTGTSYTLTFGGRGAYTLTSQNKKFSQNYNFDMASGSLTLMDAIPYISGNVTFTLTTGSLLNPNSYNVSCSTFQSNNTNTRTLTMGSGTWSAGLYWGNFNTTNLTLNSDTSTIVLGYNSSGSVTMTPGSLPYYNLSITGGLGGDGTCNIRLLGNCTFNGTVTINAPKLVYIGNGGANWSVGNWKARGRLGSVITVSRLSGTTTITKTGGGTIDMDYVTVANCNYAPARTWYYGNHSTYTSGTGLNAGPAPSFLPF